MPIERYIGLMSGTSMDGIDAVLINCIDDEISLEASHSLNYPKKLKFSLENLVKHSKSVDLDELGQLDVQVATSFAQAVNELLQNQELQAEQIAALGSHGQTIRHGADKIFPFTQQIGDPNLIAAQTGITTIADFRRKDIALGGQGAPLVPAFHQAVFAHANSDRVVVNIGGISNVSLLQMNGEVSGHDCGPGNTLMDLWAQEHIGMPYDHSGAWAGMGEVQLELLLQLLTDNYFKQNAPKSTGREYFNKEWLQTYLCNFDDIDPVDIQATLCELSAQCIARDINKDIQDKNLALDKVFICGGGAYNKQLLERLSKLVPCEITLTNELGIAVDWVEAMAFAWMAKQTLDKQSSNVPNVTGAQRKAILGGIYYP